MEENSRNCIIKAHANEMVTLFSSKMLRIVIVVMTGMFLCFPNCVSAQVVSLIEVVQVNESVHIRFSLKGNAKSYEIESYYRRAGSWTWLPMKYVSGDIGTVKVSSSGNYILEWNALEQVDSLVGSYEFKITSELSEREKKKSAIRVKDCLAYSAGTSKTPFGFTYFSSDKRYFGFRWDFGINRPGSLSTNAWHFPGGLFDDYSHSIVIPSGTDFTFGFTHNFSSEDRLYLGGFCKKMPVWKVYTDTGLDYIKDWFNNEWALGVSLGIIRHPLGALLSVGVGLEKQFLNTHSSEELPLSVVIHIGQN